MEDKIMDILTLRIKKEIEIVAAESLNDSNKVLTKAKKESEAIIKKMNDVYEKKTNELKKETEKVKSLEERVAKLEKNLSLYTQLLDKLKSVTENNKFIKKYLK